MFRSQHISERVHISVTPDVIIPIQIDAHKQTDITLEWRTVVGPPLPVANDAASVERLLAALSDPDWGVRWYAAEAIGRIKGDIGEEVRAGLQTLASDQAYERCLAQETTVQCSLVSEQAQDILRNARGQDTTPAGLDR
jgi:HEAT repeat protein